jgi:hypothetical protein
MDVETGLFSPTLASAVRCTSSAASAEIADRRTIFGILTVVHSTWSLLSDLGMKFFV